MEIFDAAHRRQRGAAKAQNFGINAAIDSVTLRECPGGAHKEPLGEDRPHTGNRPRNGKMPGRSAPRVRRVLQSC